MLSLSKKDKIEIFVVLAMFLYGGAKLIQFQGAAEIDKTAAEMTGMELMWAFYSYSKAFAITLGILEVIGGILILIRRTRLVGCLFTSAILLNVILQDIYYGVHVGALKAAILYQLLILIILWLHKEKIMTSLKTLFVFKNGPQTKTKHLAKLIIAFVVFVVFRILEYYVTIKF